MILIHGILSRALVVGSVLTVALGATARADEQPVPLVRRIASTTALAAQEYRLGVQHGRIVAEPEVEEARLFLEEAKRSALLLPEPARAEAVANLERMLAVVQRTGPADSLAAGANALAEALATRFGVTLDEVPALAPSLARGAALYRAQCASCHGALGAGDGPAAAGLDPRPARLDDAAALREASVLDFYRRISIGVAGTAMPAFEAKLGADDRWALAAYATLLRLPAAAGEVPAAMAVFPAVARLSDDSIAAMLGVAGQPGALARVAAVRSVQAAEGDGGGHAAVFAEVRRTIDDAVARGRDGDAATASSTAFDAYMAFERVEPAVRAREPGLATDLEAAFAALRTRLAGGATPAEVQALRGTLLGRLELAERAIADRPAAGSLALQSFVLLVREGLEAILIVGALLTFLVRTGAGERRRDIHIGVAAALVVSVLTAVALETVFRISPARREALEGITMLAATGVLFYVSYWLLSKMEVAKWTQFVRSRVSEAVTSGSALALASASFLAVYREGFETVLFYKALWASGGAGASLPIVAGMAGGTVVLVAVYYAINRFGVRLPLKPFFAVTGTFLYYMAFVFAGKGVAELQEGGVLPTTVLQGVPRWPALGIYPTAESLVAQGVLVALALGALAWVFVLEPRRRRSVAPAAMGPAAPAEEAPTVGAVAAAQFDPHARELLRSLERMAADLAALRNDVERLRELVAQRSTTASTRS